MNAVASERARVLACGLILIVGGWARFHHIDTAGGWSDEAFSILLSVKSPTEIMFHTTRDVYPPLYYWLLHGGMQVMGDSVLAARALSVLFGMVTVVLGMWLMSRISRRPTVIVGGFLLALLPFAVRYSTSSCPTVGACCSGLARETQGFNYSLFSPAMTAWVIKR